MALAIQSGLPAPLIPVSVPKPWGAEVWYSGIEARGESRVGNDAGAEPLSAFLGAHGRTDPPVLLKRLVPQAGHLYLEVHRTKHEVYVVDRVDAALWPGGRGELLCGTDQDLRAAHGDAGLRSAVRDAALAAERGDAGVESVERFMTRHSVAPGDSIVVPPGVPHSLRRGVEVVEFQTPVFERLILAASQPVLTQPRWDCSAAAAAMALAPAPPPLQPGSAARQPLARAEDFEAARCLLEPGTTLAVAPWSVAWVAAGGVRAGERRFGARTAFIAPDAAEMTATERTEILIACDR